MTEKDTLAYLDAFPKDDLELDYYSHHRNRYWVELQRIMSLIGSSENLLSVGVGHGHLELLLSEYGGIKIHAVDLVDRLNNSAREKFCFSKVDVSREKLPIPNDTFDVALALEMLEHMEGGYSHFLEELHRVLKPGGLLVLSTPNFRCFANMIELLRGRNPLVWAMHPELMSKWGEGQRHIYEFTERECRGMLESTGFQIERVLYSMDLDKLERPASLNQTLRNLLTTAVLRLKPNLRRGMIFTARS